jgi:hypothetical protein
MISEIVIDEIPEDVYDLVSIGFEGVLVISSGEKYIQTSDGYFPFNKSSDFMELNGYFTLGNEELTIKMSVDTFEIIKDLLDS